jgi:NitT/TauT family transport system substrate-binding protein
MPMKFAKALSTLLVSSSLLFAGTSLVGPAGAQAAQTLKLGTNVWVGFGPLYVAEALDLYKKYGLSVKLQFFSDTTLLPAALASHSVDGATQTYDAVIGAVAKGMSEKVVMPIDFSDGADAIVATSDVKKIADLKGKKIAFEPLSVSDFLLAYALETNHLAETDITPVNMTPGAIPGAMVSGSLPAGVTFEPNVSQILNAGKNKFHVVYSSHDAPGLIADVLVFDQKFIDAHPAEIKGIIQAYNDGMAYMKSHPAESYKIIGKALGVSADDVKSQLEGVYNIPLKEMPQSFVKGPTTKSFYTSGAVIGNLLQKKGQITAVPETARTIDAHFVDALAK